MFRGLLGVALIVGAAPAMADTYYATIKGTVTAQSATAFTAAGATSPIKVGDTISATFTQTTPDSVGTMLGTSWTKSSAPKVTFQIGDAIWSSLGDFMASFQPVSFDAGPDPLANYYSTMDDARGAGDLRVNGYDFEIGEFGYDIYTGPGFKGVFDQSTLAAYRNGVKLESPYRVVKAQSFAAAVAAPVPEPMIWALMISGFGLAGTAIRQRKAAALRFA
jgi:hypothetical protein